MLTLKRFYIYNGGDRFQIASFNGDVRFTQTFHFNVTYNTSGKSFIKLTSGSFCPKTSLPTT